MVEGRERKVAKEILWDRVKGEVVPFSFPRPKKAGEEVRASAIVYLQSLQDQVQQLIDENEQLVRP
jgi:hypothetical protein